MTESEIATMLYLIRSPDVSCMLSSTLVTVTLIFQQAHFLKVPSLPFYSLISMLAKFPADVDSRVFWSSGLRDILYGLHPLLLWLLTSADLGMLGDDRCCIWYVSVTAFRSIFLTLFLLAAVQVLLARIEEEKAKPAGEPVNVDYNMDLVDELVRTGINCQGNLLCQKNV